MNMEGLINFNLQMRILSGMGCVKLLQMNV